MAIRDVSLAFKALSDPTRRDILKKLRNRSMTPGELSTYFSISKPSLSHHLSLLKAANLITADKEGQKIYYSLNATVFYELLNNFLEGFK
ncbi:TPA: transcriptional regulator [Patescibacteria group bacterium]|uniref:Transcriptional repressor SdpR-like protein n=2 Tax=Bacteria division Kazan-3B-28 TaxID=1798534 RepID=A0A0G1ZG23_UNCK3|nr:MAG: transcriptional repressor SdpR-like protein [candidate division Kazan bacterium GW2011_GWA1_50_15]KKW25546.1 MAG: Transcriptional repressor SdpR-like protein [candidate division Kazan bacterium GW2011_GWC1_52_13]KKW26852.1 MAG: Transcriptional repressor SdpR-like protein [candidate division Kazan bacterium GW2011_GWB1_52_7]HAV65845.1 transcriptional regulator [Patescibacteria group bacterium]HCL47825.1 transcriptional regulator [Patescibacteria group bacterium]